MAYDGLVWVGGVLTPLPPNDRPARGMVEPTPAHRERARRSLERHVTRTTQQLVAAGSSWRAVKGMLANGELTPIGETPCAKPVYALTPAEELNQSRSIVLNWRNASAVTAISSVSRSAKCL